MPKRFRTAIVALLTSAGLLLPGALVPVGATGVEPVSLSVSAPISAAVPEPPAPVFAEVSFAAGSEASARSGATSGTTTFGTAPRTLVAASDVEGFATVGVTWAGDAVPRIEVRTQTASEWSGWQDLEVDDPTGGGPEAGRTGTAPFAIGRVDRVEARITPTGMVDLLDPRLTVIDPGVSDMDARAAAVHPASRATPVRASVADASRSGEVQATLAASMGSNGAPDFVSRALWGADESLMRWSPSQGDFRGAIVHHTAGTNNYGPGDVPAIIRGIYAYHSQTRGWGDIGYNFLVDKFGRVWEGRAGGVELETIGAHTTSYNSQTFGVSVLGNYQEATVSNEAVTAVVRILAWKMSLLGIDAGGTMSVNGKVLPTIIGHRDVAATSCPGQSLWVRQAEIRQRVKAEQARYGAIYGVGTGAFVKSPARPEVYLVVGATKHHVTSGAVLTSLSRLGRIQDAPDVYLNYLSTGPSLKRFVRDPGSGVVAFVDSNYRLRAPSCQMVADYGGSCGDLVNLSAAQWSLLSQGPELTSAYGTTNGKLFYVAGGTRREAFDAASLTAQGLPSLHNVLSEEGIGALPYGAPIIRERVIVQQRSSSNAMLHVDGRAAALTPSLVVDSALRTLPRGSLDGQSVGRVPTTSAVSGLVLASGTSQNFVLTSGGLLDVTHSGKFAPSTATSTWSANLVSAFAPQSTGGRAVALKSTSSPEIWILQNGQRRWAKTWTAYVGAFGGAAPIYWEVASTTVDSIPRGADLS
ncbi:N-acetylmuramoyl-L-alanine amidase [Oerskovia sp. Root918]|uniref:N-acetylmuramoyl-L-alanine amidase n=1 Tax=Oerskovia sp. Root918 TaxID=1736607 RepID=UPI0009E9B8C4|nr:N-acetylmuramoyl-L-alanine amidase [Oerskovia sp. Root918]